MVCRGETRAFDVDHVPRIFRDDNVFSALRKHDARYSNSDLGLPPLGLGMEKTHHGRIHLFESLLGRIGHSYMHWRGPDSEIYPVDRKGQEADRTGYGAMPWKKREPGLGNLAGGLIPKLVRRIGQT